MIDIFKDHNNKISFSRVWCSILLALYCFAAIFILIKKQEMLDVPLQLAGLVASLYGLNRFSKPQSSG